MKTLLKDLILVIFAAAIGGIVATRSREPAESPPDNSAEIASLREKIEALEADPEPPELGQQMLELQMRHNRLWWAGVAGNWSLAYFMVGELGETLNEIALTNGDALELQPEKLSEIMPAMMKPTIRAVQQALEKQDVEEFKKAFDTFSNSCTACHQLAGFDFLKIERPQTAFLDNIRYTPDEE